MSDEEYKPGREFLGVDEDCYQESQVIVERVEAALETIFSPSERLTAEERYTIGELQMKIALRRLLENVLKPGIITTEMEIIKNRWDLEVRYTFCILDGDTLVRTTQCVDGIKTRKAAMDLCVSTMCCVEAAKRDFMNKWLNSDDYSDFVYALSFACGVGKGAYL